MSWNICQNDEIEKLALDRSSIYRKCRLEEISLPLLEGNLKNVPMEEVSGPVGYQPLDSNLSAEPSWGVAMDVDEDEDGTQQVKKVLIMASR